MEKIGFHSVRCAQPRLLLSLLVAILVAGCLEPTREALREPTGTPMPRITLLTYNTLHGLEPSGMTVRASESQEARQARLDLQFRQLSLIQPDVMLLQEVNPLPEMAEQYITAMKRSGSSPARMTCRVPSAVRGSSCAAAPTLTMVPRRIRADRALSWSETGDPGWR